MKKRKSKHHIIPTSRGGDSSIDNIVEIETKIHNIYHQLFINKKPDEIIEYLTNVFWKGKWEYVAEAYQKYSNRCV